MLRLGLTVGVFLMSEAPLYLERLEPLPPTLKPFLTLEPLLLLLSMPRAWFRVWGLGLCPPSRLLRSNPPASMSVCLSLPLSLSPSLLLSLYPSLPSALQGWHRPRVILPYPPLNGPRRFRWGRFSRGNVTTSVPHEATLSIASRKIDVSEKVRSPP